MTRVVGLLMVVIAIGSPIALAIAREPATVYVLRIPENAARLAAQSGLAPVPFKSSAIFTVVIDGSRTVHVDTRRGAVIDGLDATGVHNVRVKVDGRAYARFKFQFDENWPYGPGRKRLAIYLDELYSNWRVWPCDRVRACDDVQTDGGIPDASRTP